MITVVDSLAKLPKETRLRATYTEPVDDGSVEVYAFDGQKRRIYFVVVDEPLPPDIVFEIGTGGDNTR